MSFDGRCAYDSVSRAAFLDKLAEVTPSLVPFVRAFYARQSVVLWWDGAGACHRILQGDGCEQGNALAPALFALAQHAALVAASQQLRPGEFLAAFLDDLYIVTVPNRARAALEAVPSAVEELAGVAANLGKTRVYNRAGGAGPPGISELGPEAWRGDKPLPERGFVALGTPIGAPEYVAACARERLEQEQGLLAELPQLPDLQCAWLLLLFCAAPRAQHLLRTVPPSQSAAYAEAHDHAVWGTLQALLGERGAAWPEARRLAFLPAREGGLGLLCATRRLLCRLTRAPRCPRRTCTSPCAGACASRCPSRTGIAEAMGSRGAAPRSMSWATMRQRARAADCWPAAPLCLNKRGSASRVKVWDPRAGLSLSSGCALGRSAVLRRHARCFAPSRRPTAATRGRGGRRSHCGAARRRGTRSFAGLARSGWSFLLVKRAGGGARGVRLS